MSSIEQHRHNSTAVRVAVTLASGELFFDETLAQLFIGDGSTLGGLPVVGVIGLFSYKTKTSNYNVLLTDNGTHFNNIGASAEVDFTLPAAAAGLSFSFAILAAHVLKVIANGGDLLKSDVFSAGNISNNVIYSSLTIESHEAGIWLVSAATGSWS